jgi:hypothetical protein
LSGTVGKPIALRLWASDVPTNLNAAEDELAARNRAVASNRAPESIAVIGGQVIGGAGRGAAAGAAGVGTPVPDITVNWRKHRGPGEVTFAQDRIPLITDRNPATILEAATTATFGAAGEYIVRAQVNDTSGDGGGGDQCCWTTALVRVSVTGP